MFIRRIQACSPEISKFTDARNDVIDIQVKTADPFENLQISGRKHPSLRPILNKHRKTPSLACVVHTDSNVSEEKPCSKSMKYNKSEITLPKIFKVPLLNKNCITREKIRAVHTERGVVEKRNIATPFFRPGVSENEKQDEGKRDINLLRKKKNTRVRFFDHIKKKDTAEVSFGDTSESFNSMFFRNNKS